MTHQGSRISLVLEQTLGHRTHSQNFERALNASHFDHALHRVDYGRVRGVPWALHASVGALRAVRSRPSAGVTFFHTQSVSLLAPLATRGRPYVVSLDATPVQVDAMGRWYEHSTGLALTEGKKRAWYRSVFARAAAIVTWSRWAADSLATDYGILDVPVEVAHPGAPATFFSIERSARPSHRPTILFVGGDFERKGGPALLRAYERLRDRAELVIVTEQPLDVPPGVRLIRNVSAGSPEHRSVFADADLFCLPTLGDCTPLVIAEAMAAGLPVVTTRLGSNEESVGADAGVLVPPGDDEALAEALDQLLDSRERLREMGEAARARAREFMNADRNALRVLGLLDEIAEQRR